MRLHMKLLVLIGLLSVPALLLAEDTYTIKLKKSAKGDVTNVVKDEKVVSKIQGKKDGETILDELMTQKESFKFKEDILAMDDEGHSTKLRRKYEKAQKTVEDATDDYFIQGKTIIIERIAKPDKEDKKDGEKGSGSKGSGSKGSGSKGSGSKGSGSKVKEKRYRFMIEGGKELTAEEAEPLDKEFNEKESEIDEDKILLPKKAVALNESWDIEQAEELFKEMVTKDDEVVLDLKKAKGTGKLTKVYTKSDMQFGVIEYQLKVPVKAIGNKDAKVQMNEGTLFTFNITMDTCIDGKCGSGVVISKFGMKGKGKVSAGGVEVDVEVDVQGDSKDIIEEVK